MPHPNAPRSPPTSGTTAEHRRPRADARSLLKVCQRLLAARRRATAAATAMPPMPIAPTPSQIAAAGTSPPVGGRPPVPGVAGVPGVVGVPATATVIEADAVCVSSVAGLRAETVTV